MAIEHSFQMLFAVPMTCDSCARAVSDAVHKLGGITNIEANLDEQLVVVEGTEVVADWDVGWEPTEYTAPPSAIVAAIQSTGRDAILRGSGTSNSAAVSILESYQHLNSNETVEERARRERDVRGLARIVQVSPTVSLVDLTVRGVPPGIYRVTIREFGDLNGGVASTGPVWAGSGPKCGPRSASAVGLEPGQGVATGGPPRPVRGDLGVVEVGEDGYGNAFVPQPFQVWEVIGHAMVVSLDHEATGGSLRNDGATVAGVIARSAGMWDNDKTVCSCTGKTLWEERKAEVEKGML